MNTANDNAPAVGYCVEHKPTIWERLGFGHAHVPRPDQELIAYQGFHPGHIILETYTKLDWKDRLRVLLSGWMHSEICLLTEHAAGNTRAVSAANVLPPGVVKL